MLCLPGFGGDAAALLNLPSMALAPVCVKSSSFMILASMCAGLILVVMGLSRMGRFVSLVPDSIVVRNLTASS